MEITVASVSSPSSPNERFLATDAVSGLTASGPNPQRADLNCQVVVRAADEAAAEASYSTVFGRSSAATEHNAATASRRGNGNGNGNAGRP